MIVVLQYIFLAALVAILGICWSDQYLGMKTIALKYCDYILQLTSQLSACNIVRKLMILETNPKSEELKNFYLEFV